MDIVVKSRRAEVSERFRAHATEKLAKMERLDHRIIRLEVEVSEERNPRQADVRERVELTVLSKGPVIRAEAAAADIYGAFDIALDRLAMRLRRAADRRREHHGRKAESLRGLPYLDGAAPAPAPDELGDESPTLGAIAREKTVEAEPMTLDEALERMELIGHDFYLFPDLDTGLSSVVYRRHGYDYGVIRLKS